MCSPWNSIAKSRTKSLSSHALRMVFRLPSRQLFSISFSKASSMPFTWSMESPMPVHARNISLRPWTMLPLAMMLIPSSPQLMSSILEWEMIFKSLLTMSAMLMSDSSRSPESTFQINSKMRFRRPRYKRMRSILPSLRRITSELSYRLRFRMLQTLWTLSSIRQKLRLRQTFRRTMLTWALYNRTSSTKLTLMPLWRAI